MGQVLKVNRYLKDKAMDHIDHALGRPVDPMAETYRNYFSVNAGCDLDSEMALSPHWRPSGLQGALRFYEVTGEGKAALRDHLKAIGDKHRVYSIDFKGFRSFVVASSHSKARYSYWLDVSDCCPDLSFKDFCEASRVRLV